MNGFNDFGIPDGIGDCDCGNHPSVVGGPQGVSVRCFHCGIRSKTLYAFQSKAIYEWNIKERVPMIQTEKNRSDQGEKR